MRVFAYYRISTKLQKDAWKSQRLACRNYAKEKDISIIEEFVEKESAFKERPIFLDMLSRLPDVDGVLVTDLDRLVRDPYNLNFMINRMQELKKVIVLVTGQEIVDSPEHRLIANIFASVAQFEAARTKERQIRGIKAYKEEKGHWGRPSAKITKYMFEKYLENGVLIFPKTTIARLFGVSSPTLRNWMKENDYGHLIEKKPEWL